jgi:tetratricopeptide (TPR) repeat protein
MAYAPLSSPLRLVGRDQDLDRLRHALEDVGIVELLGPAGVGKTVLAAELARHERTLGHAVLMGSAAELEASGAGLDPLLSSLERDAWQRARGAPLLVIDDAQRDPQRAGALADRLRVLVPDVRLVLATRRSLAIAGARSVDLAPLAPAFASQLLVLRARDGTGLAMDETDRDAIAQIVETTGGLPYAVELAARRLRVLGPSALAARLLGQPDAALAGATARVLELASAEDVEALAPRASPEERLLSLRDQSLVQRGDGERLFVFPSFGVSARRALPPARRESIDAAYAAVIAARPHPRPADLQRALFLAIEAPLVARLSTRLVEALGQRAASSEELALLERAQRLTEGTPAALEAAKARAHALGRAHAPVAVDALRALALACEAAGDLAGSAEALAAMAEEHFKAFRMVEARVAWERARQRMQSSGDHHGALRVMHRLIALHASIGRLSEAESLAEETAGEAMRLGSASALAEVTASLGTLALQRGEPDVAEARYAESAARAQALGMPRLESVSLGYGALAALIRGAPDKAARLARHAAEGASAAGHGRALGLFTLVLAASFAELGRLDRARQLVPQALAPLVGVFGAVGDVLAGIVDLAEARVALEAGEAERAFGRALALAQRIARARALRVGVGASEDLPRMLDVSDDLRIVLRFVEARTHALMSATKKHASRDEVGETARPLLGVAPGAVRFRFRGDTTSLASRPLLARLLWVLAQRSLGGQRASSEDLVAAGWPDEKLSHRAGRTRLYVALGELRKLGLRDVIRSGPRGYALDVPIEIDLIG